LKASELLKKHPTALVEKAIKGMLPKNKLGASSIYKPFCIRRCRAWARGSKARTI